MNQLWLSIGLIVTVVAIVFYQPLFALIGRLRPAVTPTTGTSKPSAELTVGELAERFASVRDHFEAIGDAAAVAKLDETAACIFRDKDEKKPGVVA